MNLARVIGNVTAATSHPGLQGVRLMICELLDEQGKATGQVVGAADWLGAGIGSTVMVDADGDACQQYLKDAKTPLRNVISAIVDQAKGVSS